jgi:hypothetical protein
MINLLPTEHKKQIRAARVNVVLVRYNVIFLATVVFLASATGFAYFFLVNSKQLAENTIAENASKEGSYAEIKTKADAFKAELASAKSILDSQTSYAKAALVISSLLPEGTSIDKLELNEKSFASPLLLTVNIRDEQAAAQLLKSFTSSPLFSNVTKGKISIGTDQYPYTMELTVTMSKAAAQ